jgi:hypothetical protein
MKYLLPLLFLFSSQLNATVIVSIQEPKAGEYVAINLTTQFEELLLEFKDSEGTSRYCTIGKYTIAALGVGSFILAKELLSDKKWEAICEHQGNDIYTARFLKTSF